MQSGLVVAMQAASLFVNGQYTPPLDETGDELLQRVRDEGFTFDDDGYVNFLSDENIAVLERQLISANVLTSNLGLTTTQ